MHAHLTHRRVPTAGRALALCLLVAAVAQYRQPEQVEFEEDQLLPDLEEPDPLDDDDDDLDDDDDDEWDEEEPDPLEDDEDDEPDPLDVQDPFPEQAPVETQPWI
jgi:hypothetical protein